MIVNSKSNLTPREEKEHHNKFHGENKVYSCIYCKEECWMIITPNDDKPEEMIEVNYGRKEILSRTEFERRIRNGSLPINVDNGVYKVLRND